MLSKSNNFFYVFSISVILFLSIGGSKESIKSKEHKLLELLGTFPTSPALQIDTLESVKLDSGWRYKIEYVAEQADPLFGRPVDKI